MHRAWAIGLGSLAVTAAAGAYCARRAIAALPIDGSLPGTFVADRVQPAGAALRPWLEGRRSALAGRPAFLLLSERAECAGGEVLANGAIAVTEGELGVGLDVDATARAAVEHATGGTLRSRLARMWRAARGRESVEAVFRVDLGRARATLERVARQVRCDPSDARLDVEAHERVEARPGFELDVGRSLERVLHAPHDDPFTATLALRKQEPDVTTEMLANVDVGRVLSVYETDFRHHAGARAINIARAARYLDGTMLAPGKPFSFNRVVGHRTTSRGFVEAPVIVADEMERGIGGGVCQVATTLHAAAVFGGLEVLARRSHSRPSDYAPIGLDATVVEDKVDLKLQNPYDVTLMIHASLPSRTHLRIELLGREPPGKIEHLASVRGHEGFCRRVTVKPELGSDTFDVHQKGRPGLEVLSTVRTTFLDGTRASKSYRSKYYPVPQVIWVGPGFDLAGLPALPEGAREAAGDDDDCAPPAAESLDPTDP